MFVIPYGVWQVWICGVVVVVFRYAWRVFFSLFCVGVCVCRRGFVCNYNGLLCRVL